MEKFYPVVKPTTNSDYEFYVNNDGLTLTPIMRYWSLVGLTNDERELFLAIVENQETPFSVYKEDDMTARMLRSYGLIVYNELINPEENSAAPTRIGLLIYEYSFLRDMRTVDEATIDSQKYSGEELNLF